MEEERHRKKGQAYEAEDAIPPPKSQVCIQGRCCQWNERCKETSENRVGSQRKGGSLRTKSIHHVELSWHQDPEIAGSKEGGADDGHDPVSLLLGCPAIPEDADGHGGHDPLHGLQASFGVGRISKCALQLAAYGGKGSERDGHSNPNAEI